MKKMKFICMLLIFVMSICTMTVFAEEVNKLTYFVSIEGTDDGDGSFENPFNTLNKARDHIRELKKNGQFPVNGITVYIRGGQYKVPDSFSLTEEDSGTETGMIEYCSYGDEEVLLIGGAEVNFSDFKRSTDPRIRSSAAGMVYSYNLLDNDIEPFDGLDIAGHSQYYLYSAGWLPTDGGKPLPTVLFDEQPMDIARYPNEGYMYINTVINEGSYENKKTNPDAKMVGSEFTVNDSRIEGWANADDAWVFGYWAFDWSDMSLPVSSIDTATRTIKTDYAIPLGGPQPERNFYIFNLLEELDAPGEWFYDKSNGEFYIYPLSDKKDAKVLLGFSSQSIINISKAKNITIRGLNIKGGRGLGVNVTNCDNVKVMCCTISDVSNIAINISGTNNVADANHIYRVGMKGISVSGGDIKNMANNVISNNIIHNYATFTKTYQAGIYCVGAGQLVTNNLIYDAPHLGINFGGNFNTIQYNHVYDVMKESTDGGAFYAGQRYEHWGNVLKGNVIHDIRYGLGGAHGIYLDDCFSGTTVTENILYNISSCGIFNQGGRSNKYTNNITANCGTGIYYSGFQGSAQSRTVWDFVSEETINNPDWREVLGEEWYNIPNDDPVDPKYGVVKNNVSLNTTTPLNVSAGFRGVSKDWLYENNELEQPLVVSKDIGFMNAEAQNYAIKDASKILEKLPEFTTPKPEQLSVAQIQLQKHLKNSAAAFVIGRTGAYIDYKRTLIDKNDPEIVPFINNDTTYVPLRFFAESIGAEVGYEDGKAVIEYGQDKMTVSPEGVYLNGENLETENSVLIRNDRMFVPIRACGELFQKEILWRDSGLIIISDENLEEVMDERLSEALYNRIW